MSILTYSKHALTQLSLKEEGKKKVQVIPDLSPYRELKMFLAYALMNFAHKVLPSLQLVQIVRYQKHSNQAAK